MNKKTPKSNIFLSRADRNQRLEDRFDCRLSVLLRAGTKALLKCHLNCDNIIKALAYAVRSETVH